MIVFNIVILVIQAEDKTIRYTPFPSAPPREPGPDDVFVTCERCGWQNVYQDKSTAKRGLAGHSNWCNRRAI